MGSQDKGIRKSEFEAKIYNFLSYRDKKEIELLLQTQNF